MSPPLSPLAPALHPLASLAISLALLAALHKAVAYLHHALSINTPKFILTGGTSSSATRRRLPGPKGLPLLGNVHQLPNEFQERTFAEWGKTYGDLFQLHIFHTPAIVINSVSIARDLLEKRSANYSDRPALTMLNDMMGWNNVVTHFSTGDRFRKHRKWIQSGIQDREALEGYRCVQEREGVRVLCGLVGLCERGEREGEGSERDTEGSKEKEGEGEYEGYVKRYAASILTHIAYGHTLTSLTDPLLILADKATTETVRAGSPGSNPLGALVEFYPVLKNYPMWLPGSGFRVKLEEVRGHVRRMMDVPYEMVKELYTKGTATPCLTSSLLESHLSSREHDTRRLSAMEEMDVKGVAAVLYAAGTDTTISILTSFLLYMTLHPSVFRKAQQEMDRVVGRERLPTWEDREALSWLGCVWREVLRCTAPAPLGIPHATAREDVYKGYVIPKGAMVIVNIWGMLHNPETYPDPDAFKPERFEGLSKEEMEKVDPRGVVFGFGRRKCPGEQLAEASVFLFMSYIIATMDISPFVDPKTGEEVSPSGEFHSGFVLHPKTFKCRIRPRSEKAVKLVKDISVLLGVE